MSSTAETPIGKRHHKVDLRDIRLPLTMAIALVVAVLVGSAGIVVAWTNAQTHGANEVIHLDQREVRQFGGPVHKHHLEAAKAEIKATINAVDRAQGRRLRDLTLVCKTRQGKMECRTPQGIR